MKFATLVFTVLLLAGVAFTQEPVNTAVSQPVAHQSNAFQQTVTQPTAHQGVPGSIPSVFVPLPTGRAATQPNVVERTVTQTPAPAVPKPTQPAAHSSQK